MGTTLVKPTEKKPRRAGKKLDELTGMERMFVEELLADKTFNATRAAEKAGYATPATAATKVLKKPIVQQLLGHRLQERIWRCEVDADRVLRELMAIGLFNPQDMFDEKGEMIDLLKLPPQVARAVRSVKVSYQESPDEEGNFNMIKNVELQFWDKMAALQLLARHLGMLQDKIQVQHGLVEGPSGDALLKVIEHIEQEKREAQRRTVDAAQVLPLLEQSSAGTQSGKA